MGGLFMKTRPGDQVHVIPKWAFKTLAVKGQIEDLVNFSKMRQWFTQEQLVAIDGFSKVGLGVLFTPTTPQAIQGSVHTDCYSGRSIGYSWFFPEDAGVSVNGNDADKYARNQLSDLANNPEYAMKMVDQYVLDYFKGVPGNTIDLYQSYSVYSSSDKLIVLALDQGILSTAILTRKEELRLTILRSIVEKLQMYYESHVVHNTQWFELYLKELDRLK